MEFRSVGFVTNKKQGYTHAYYLAGYIVLSRH